MTLSLAAPAVSDLSERARQTVPLLAARGQWIDQNGVLPPDVVESLSAAGMFRVSVASQYGGFEGTARDWVEVTATLAEGNVATAWVVGVYTLQNWVAGLFPQTVLDTVFAEPDVRVCGIGPKPGHAKQVDDGFRVSGKWPFTSGARNADWKMGLAATEDGRVLFVMMPMSDFEISDDWQTLGLSGTGSVTVTAHDAFVPDGLVVESSDPLHMTARSADNAAKAVFRTPLLVNSTISLLGVYLGAARQVLTGFLGRLPGRAISHTNYESQLEAPVTHLQVGEAKMLIEEAEVRAFALADAVDRRSATGEHWSVSDRVWAHAQGGRVAQLCKRAADLVASAAGGSSIYSHVALTRTNIDLQAAARHAAFNSSFALELYGRDACGLEPNTPIL